MSFQETAVALHNNKEVKRNCAQCVLQSVNEILNLDPKLLDQIGAGLGAGLGSGELCGAVNGGAIALGLLGKEKDTKKLVSSFKGQFGTCLCRSLKRTKKVPCDDCIAYAAKIVEEIVNDGRV